MGKHGPQPYIFGLLPISTKGDGKTCMFRNTCHIIVRWHVKGSVQVSGGNPIGSELVNASPELFVLDFSFFQQFSIICSGFDLVVIPKPELHMYWIVLKYCCKLKLAINKANE